MTDERFHETVCLCGEIMNAGEERCGKCEAEMARGLAMMAAHVLAESRAKVRLLRGDSS